MKNLSSLALRYTDGILQLLDQHRLPAEENWLPCESPESVIGHIRALRVRGAPLIGVSAALSLADYAERGASREQFDRAAEALRAARPTAVNLMICIDRMKVSALESTYSVDAIVKAAESIFDEDVALCRRMGDFGAGLIGDGESVLTHCNTGGLATAGIGTALGVIRRAHEQGKKIHVFVDETRPLLQGGRLTAWELERLGVPYTLICDNMAGSLMREGRIARVIVGADRIAMNGDFANKVGTYGVAALARFHEVPFHVTAPYTTIDPECASGREIPIEQRSADEIRGVSGSFGQVIWSPADARVHNPAFDVSPGELVTSYILDRGIFAPSAIADALNSK